MKTCCGYSKEAPHRGASSEYPQHMFLWKNKKKINTSGLRKASYHEIYINMSANGLVQILGQV